MSEATVPRHAHRARRRTAAEAIADARGKLPELVAGRGLIGRFVYLVATQAVTVLLGFVYWTTSAHVAPADQVGVASAAMFASSLIAALGVLGITSLVLVVLGDLEIDDQRALISTCVLVSGLVACAVGFIVWGASDLLGPSFRTLGHNPLDALLFVLGAALTTIATVLDAVAIGLRRGPAQLGRNIVAAMLKVGLVYDLVVIGARTTTGLLAAWDVSMLASFILVPWLLGLPRTGIHYRFVRRIALIKRFGTLSLRHHILTLAVTSMGFFLPVIAALFARPKQMAYFSMAELVSGCALLLPQFLTMSLFVESSGDDNRLRRNLRKTLPVAVLCCFGIWAVLEPLGGFVLSMFGHAYAAHGLVPLRLLLLGGLPYVAKDHFVAVRRAQERLGEAAWIGGTATLCEVTAALIGGALGGLDGLCIGWLCCVYLEALYFVPRVYAAMRRPRALARVTPLSTLFEQERLGEDVTTA